MKQFFLKSLLYIFLLLLTLESLTRVFHLAKDTPLRYIDDVGVEKWIPNQNGFSVTGNRKQNFSEYRINSSGFNSYREFSPTKDKTELALVGDSFFQGFHQDYYNSIGKKIERKIQDLEVYEYGYAGYDFADQIHLINVYKKDFDLIDHVVIYLHFPDDLKRDTYYTIKDRVNLQSRRNLLLQKSKLLVYIKSIGILDTPLNLVSKLIQSIKKNKPIISQNTSPKNQESIFIENFKKLVDKYGYNKNKFTLLLDSNITPNDFLIYLNKNSFKYIDFHPYFKNATKKTNLIYDKHWNDNGREIIANLICNSTSKKL